MAVATTAPALSGVDSPAALKELAGADEQHDLEQAFVSFLRDRGH